MGFSIDCIMALYKAFVSFLFIVPSASRRSCNKSRRCIHVAVVVAVAVVVVLLGAVVEGSASNVPSYCPDDDDDDDDTFMPRTRDSWNDLLDTKGKVKIG